MKAGNKGINVLVITHHFPPEVNGTATRIYEIIKALQNMNLNLKFFVVAPPPVRPFGKFPITFKFLNKNLSRDNSVLVIQVWSYQPKSSSPNFIERILN
ncbi:MAG: hypothetical protein QXH64_03150, partial [Nitrososphaeria archaeon]